MIRSCFLMLLLFFAASQSSAQSKIKQFKELSCPEKRWVIFHPFIAKKAFKITQQVLKDVDSVKKSGIIGADINGGKLDAFKHAYWMGCLSNKVGACRSLKLGKAHEKGNYLQFKKHELEETILPDSISSVMDLHNNAAGADAVKGFKNISRQETQQKIITALKDGKLLIIKKDAQGNYLYCDGSIINMQLWLGKWGIPKCLISSE